jgi:hypothetical protein
MGWIGNAPSQGLFNGGQIVDGSIGTVDIADSAVTAQKLAAAAITDKLGYTPVNKAGDTITGTLSLSKLDLTTANGEGYVHFNDASSGDLYMDVVPNTRTVRLRNWNKSSPNIESTSFQTGKLFLKPGTWTSALEIQSTNKTFAIYNEWANKTDTISLGNITNGIEGINIDQNGNITLPSGNLILASGKGIDFSANSNATNRIAEILDDYEYGTWTPRLTGTSGGVYTMGGVNAGRYLKVGRKVIAWASVEWTGQTSAYSGNLCVHDLPFTSVGVRATGSIGAISYGLTFSGGYNRFTYLIDPGYTFAYIIQDSQTGGGYSHSPGVSSTGLIYGVTVTYEAT